MSIPVPIIKLEVEYMKHTMVQALSRYTSQIDEALRQAVENYCTPENLERVIQAETTRVLDQAIKEEVNHWFVYGEGRKAIKEAVEKKLRDNTTHTPLDWE